MVSKPSGGNDPAGRAGAVPGAVRPAVRPMGTTAPGFGGVVSAGAAGSASGTTAAPKTAGPAPRVKVNIVFVPMTPKMHAKSIMNVHEVNDAPLPFLCDGKNL